MPDEKKKRMCPRCDDKKEYDEDTANCAAGHDIPMEIYLFGRESEREKKAKEAAEKNKPKSMLGSLSRLGSKK